MSEWGMIRQTVAIGSNFNGAAPSAAAAETEGELRTFTDLTAGGLFDLSFIRGTGLEVKRILINAGDAEFWNLSITIGSETHELYSEADFSGAAVALIYPTEPLVITQLGGEELKFVTTTGVGDVLQTRFVELLVSRW